MLTNIVERPTIDHRGAASPCVQCWKPVTWCSNAIGH